MRPKREALEQVVGSWDADYWGRWIIEGLCGWHDRNEGRHAFAPLHPFFCIGPHIAEDFANIYHSCNSASAQALRMGLVTAIAQTMDTELLRVMFAIAVSIKAWEVVSVISDKLIAHPEMLQEGILLEESLHAFASLAENAGPAPHTMEAVRGLRLLAESPYFPDVYAAPLLVTLSRIAPDDLENHMLLLRPQITKAFRIQSGGNLREEMGSWKKLVERVDRYLGVQRLAQLFGEMAFCPDDTGLDLWQKALRDYLNPACNGEKIILRPTSEKPVPLCNGNRLANDRQPIGKAIIYMQSAGKLSKNMFKQVHLAA